MSFFDVFSLRDKVISDYKNLVTSFFGIKNKQMDLFVKEELQKGAFWPSPLVQLNPGFKRKANITELVQQNKLHPICEKIFLANKQKDDLNLLNCKPLDLYTHQVEALDCALNNENYVVTTGTGSGKSLTFIIPIVNDILKRKKACMGIQAIIVYPMNALANSQQEELLKYINYGFAKEDVPIQIARYTGQDKEEEREKLRNDPPHILITNYMMLELMLTRLEDQKIFDLTHDLHYLVFDELHTYRGRQGSDVALLIRRLKERSGSKNIICVGTSATIAAEDSSDPKKEVAECASKIFGVNILPKNVIGETLERHTEELQFSSDSEKLSLQKSTKKWAKNIDNHTLDSLKSDPLCSWLESKLGVQYDEKSNQLIRSKPRPLEGKNGISLELKELCSLTEETCIKALKNILRAVSLTGENNRALFPFKLHQFITRGGNLYTSLDRSFFSLEITRYAPLDPNENGNKKNKILYPVAFCRQCGADYFTVKRFANSLHKTTPHLEPRHDLSDESDKNGESGFVYMHKNKNISQDEFKNFIYENLPDAWWEENSKGEIKLGTSHKEHVPRIIYLSDEGDIYENKQEHSHIAAYFCRPFRYCLECDFFTDNARGKDFWRLATLGTEGRSTSTTVLALSVINSLRESDGIDDKAKKLMSFTDNRQDASLQSGHFNDFIDTVQIRRALWQALRVAPPSGIQFDNLAEALFNAFEMSALQPQDYMRENSQNPSFAQRRKARDALKELLVYRALLDLSAEDWRITLPSLDRTNMLKITFPLLDECFKEKEELASVKNSTLEVTRNYFEEVLQLVKKEEDRIWGQNIFISLNEKVLYEFLEDLATRLRKNLCIESKFLEDESLIHIERRIEEELSELWQIDRKKNVDHCKYAWPGPLSDESMARISLSAYSVFGRKIRNELIKIYPDEKVTRNKVQAFIPYLFGCLIACGIALPPHRKPGVPLGVRLKLSDICWKKGEITPKKENEISLAFFVDLYQEPIVLTKYIRAAEHTAQVPDLDREERESLFRNGDLQLLCCSPTMELGVDISSLNVVNMRNVPPTPANYAQRSGRAGRGGQAAFVYTYCSSGNSHDQYFFRNSQDMVAGSVKPPPLDLSNEDLIRSHVHAIWLASAGVRLGSKMTDVIDLNDEKPDNTFIKEDKVTKLKDINTNNKALLAARKVLDAIPELQEAEWYKKNPKWLDEIIKNAYMQFDLAFDRWRLLFKSALNQRDKAQKISNSNAASKEDRMRADREIEEAKAQIEYLRGDDREKTSADFYPYRYLASEGFLPGYNFPRLPLSAFIPGLKGFSYFKRRHNQEKPEYLARPRFIALSEFGPQSLIYHNGSRYKISKVILPQRNVDGNILTQKSLCCNNCGYLHIVSHEKTYDICENCYSNSLESIDHCFQMQNVSTHKVDRISADEEERTRYGYKVRSLFRFAERGHEKIVEKMNILNEQKELLFSCHYGPGATLWRMNEGWLKKRSDEDSLRGFLLDKNRGRWERAPGEGSESDFETKELIVPYVEDRKNALFLDNFPDNSKEFIASFQAALKTAIQIVAQLAESELSAETLSNQAAPRGILFYEAAEGGAGALRKISLDERRMQQVAKEALKLCHYDPDTGEDILDPMDSRYCISACYKCLMGYSNQQDHAILNRKLIRSYLFDLTKSHKETLTVAGEDAKTQLDKLLKACESELEKKFIQWLYDGGFNLPNKAQKFIPEINARPDFIYTYNGQNNVFVFVDGPHHDSLMEQKKDKIIDEACMDIGVTSLRFHHTAPWENIVIEMPDIFGRGVIKNIEA
ncbi:DEAD/DEAH box helicase [Fluviispira sanaruensis]|uniref:DUF1998 domain-containing protein n=1 Tax=Fluviispira sanaruensis TaxID=2493639 RepID=A0A4P2VLU7_FLUSA|nr:DEAD/DEAH box helicase [Fluviispira sanaruensis]BBH53871.1 DUF1998 domain-containing protein [Fluviispira sanaruensis]